MTTTALRNFAILHVEDDPDIRTIVAMALAIDPGMTVRSAGSAAVALTMLTVDRGGWRPDLLLLDVMMPDMDGPGLYRAIRALPGAVDVPVVFMTARTQAADHHRYRAVGALGIIVKPFDPVSLAQRVRTLFEAAV